MASMQLLASAANHVDVWWDSNNKIKIMRCYRNFKQPLMFVEDFSG